jgi:hypothetical protein
MVQVPRWSFLHNQFIKRLLVHWKSGSMYSTIGSGAAPQATPQGRRHKRAEVGFELTIKRLPVGCLDHWATTSLHLNTGKHILGRRFGARKFLETVKYWMHSFCRESMWKPNNSQARAKSKMHAVAKFITNVGNEKTKRTYTMAKAEMQLRWWIWKH